MGFYTDPEVMSVMQVHYFIFIMMASVTCLCLQRKNWGLIQFPNAKSIEEYVSAELLI